MDGRQGIARCCGAFGQLNGSPPKQAGKKATPCLKHQKYSKSGAGGIHTANHLCHIDETSTKRRFEADLMTRTARPAFGTLLFFAISFALSLYFTFAAVQGDFGLFRRAEIAAETQDLKLQLKSVRAEVARMENLTTRMSDDYLDLDLLDEQTRKVLGMIRPDEIVIR
jgi:cell division protein FtsB